MPMIAKYTRSNPTLFRIRILLDFVVVQFILFVDVWRFVPNDIE